MKSRYAWIALLAGIGGSIGAGACGGGKADQTPCTSGVAPGRRAMWLGAPDGGADGLYLIDASSGQPGCEVDLVDDTENPAGFPYWSDDGKLIALAKTSSIDVFDVSTTTPAMRALPVAGLGIDAFSPSGQWLVIEGTTPPAALSAIRTDMDGAQPVALGTLSAAVNVVFAPTGDRVALFGSDRVRMVDLDATGGPAVTDWMITQTGTTKVLPAWSYDGRWLAVSYSTTTSDVVDIFDTTMPTAAAIELSQNAVFVAWSPAADRFTTMLGTGTQAQLTVEDMSSGTPTPTKMVAGSTWSGDVWVDATRFLATKATTDGSGATAVSLFDADTGAQTPLTATATNWQQIPGRQALLVEDTAGTWGGVPFDGSAGWSFGACPQPPVYSPDGTVAACANGSKTTIMDGATGASKGSIGVGGTFAWSPDSATAWVVNGDASPPLFDLATMSTEEPGDPSFEQLESEPLWQPAGP